LVDTHHTQNIPESIKMKILCLHGKGTNSEIFEMQTENFRQLLPSNYQYTFIDGEYEAAPAPGIDNVFPGPYRRYLPDNSVESTAEQHGFISEIIAEEGPFDGVLAFSQGASLIASILLHHEIEKPLSRPPFRFAVFICSTYAHSARVSLGKDVTEHVKPEDRPKSRESFDSGYSSDQNTADNSVHLFCVEVEKARIQIPTAHIYGNEDPLRHESIEVELMCNKNLAVSYAHKGGHDIPMDEPTSKCISDVIHLATKLCETIS